uniref:Uncharacterized protein n=1 Tax=Setaria digitata TaxID=48799 RepID=A0A915PP43_9BILA
MKKESPVIFIKQQWINEELQLVESIIQESLTAKKQLWLDEIQKLSVLKGREAQRERVNKLNYWISNTSVQYYCFSSSQFDFKDNLVEVLHRNAPTECIHYLITAISQRPPALHWTSLPQKDEAQITFKIIFPRSCFMKSELLELVKRINKAYKWQYRYEWRHGVLFRIEAAKIAIIKHDPETLEMSGRIDNAVMNDDSDIIPMKSIWPYLSIAFSVAVEYFDELLSQYIIRIIPFGDIFYEETDAPARAFDLTQLLISNDCLKRVAYRDEGILLYNYISEIKPKTVGEISKMKAKSDNSVNNETDLESDSVHVELPERAYPNSRGRRVSFGTIKCIPQPSEKDTSNVASHDVPNDDEPKETEYKVIVDEYVDVVLDEMMREIKI